MSEIRFDRLDERIDRMLSMQTDMQIDIQEHIRRTSVAEDNIDRISTSIAPIQEHVAFVRGIGKLLTALFAIVGSIAAVWQLFVR